MIVLFCSLRIRSILTMSTITLKGISWKEQPFLSTKMEKLSPKYLWESTQEKWLGKSMEKEVIGWCLKIKIMKSCLKLSKSNWNTTNKIIPSEIANDVYDSYRGLIIIYNRYDCSVQWGRIHQSLREGQCRTSWKKDEERQH